MPGRSALSRRYEVGLPGIAFGSHSDAEKGPSVEEARVKLGVSNVNDEDSFLACALWCGAEDWLRTVLPSVEKE